MLFADARTQLEHALRGILRLWGANRPPESESGAEASTDADPHKGADFQSRRLHQLLLEHYFTLARQACMDMGMGEIGRKLGEFESDTQRYTCGVDWEATRDHLLMYFSQIMDVAAAQGSGIGARGRGTLE